MLHQLNLIGYPEFLTMLFTVASIKPQQTQAAALVKETLGTYLKSTVKPHTQKQNKTKLNKNSWAETLSAILGISTINIQSYIYRAV